ncbi:MAG: hypothetical protein AB7G13_18965 [Lautropia sp.]
MFYRVLARLAAQVLLWLAAVIWGVIALFDTERVALRPAFAFGCLLAVAALLGFARNWRRASWLGAIALVLPIGVLAHVNDASPWLWLFWLVCAWATERWMRDGGTGAGDRR